MPTSAMPPHVVVLLAAHNGARWIGAQLDSILAQQGVSLQVLVSDDASTDTTREQVLARAAADARVTLLPARGPFGSAASNFFVLLASLGQLGTPPTAVALADQDDVWHPDKLQRALAALQTRRVAAVSGSVTAFWPDGRQQLLQKSQPLRAADHLFESAGPGCTYVLRGDVALRLSAWVVAHQDALKRIAFHDWFVYAWVRTQGDAWWIDPVPAMDYRQHDHNVFGARAGWRGLARRSQMLFGPWYRQQVLAIAHACGADHHPLIVRLRRDRWRDRWALVHQVGAMRRKPLDRLVLALALLFRPGGQP